MSEAALHLATRRFRYNSTQMHRRDLLTALASTALAAAQTTPSGRIARKGRIKQSCFTRSLATGPNAPRMSLDDMLQLGQRLGAVGFDMLPPAQWPQLKKYGLMSTMGTGGGVAIETGIIHKEMHADMAKSLATFIDTCAAAGCPNVLIAGGQRKGLSYTEGADNAVAFLNTVKGHAEEKGVTLCLEVMNDKYQNPSIGRVDQVGNHLSWVADVCQRVNSPRVKILFDIYHVQIMDGNVAENIKTAFPLIGHFHTAGVPGRHELDETQELNYSFIFRTIADLGYTGFVAHEYDPTPGRDPVQLLEKVFAIADV
jgi:hydroxypyruvate isomerase